MAANTYAASRSKARQIIKIWVCLAGILWGALVFSPTANAQSCTYYVRSGDSLSVIAARYGVSVSTLVRVNSIQNPNRLYTGQRLTIPSCTRSQPAAPTATPRPRTTTAVPRTVTPQKRVVTPEKKTTPQKWVVTPQKRYVTPTPRWVTATPTPRKSPVRSYEVRYTVRRGDSLYGIARIYGVTLSALIKRNGLTSTVVYVGQSLIIPVP